MLTPFAKKVYSAVLSIPLGETRTYKWVAKKSGSKRAFRAVGTVLKNNPYPLTIPCHRVVKSNNMLGEYALGRENKKRILDLEKEISRCLKTRK
jgi:O-6-methylguanine DNA methyltransferase